MALQTYMYVQVLCLTTFWSFLLMSLAHGEVTQCSQSHTQPKLRFVAQLSVNGCPIFVHDTGANDGPHLTVEPLMCVTQSLHKVLPRYDPVTQQTYVSVPVMLRDDAMLTEVEHQLRHLSPKSVKFATVSDISVSTDNLTVIEALGFDWTSEESTGVLRVGCQNSRGTKCARLLKSCNTSIINDTLKGTRLSAALDVNGSVRHFNYRAVANNQRFFYPEQYIDRSACLTTCTQLRFVRLIRLNNCTARVHQRLDMKGHFLIEPLLCHNITSITNESIMYDYSRDIYYLKLDVVLQDDITLDAVRSKLADLSPLNVTFMRLWRAESVVASALSRRYQIGGLMVSGDWRSGQLRFYCRTEDDCMVIIHTLSANPFVLWRQIRWRLTSVVDQKCLKVDSVSRYLSAFSIHEQSASSDIHQCPTKGSLQSAGVPTVKTEKRYSVIQQRLTGIVSFQRTWSEYERGFGDVTDFWIGLSRIHLLSINGATLRVEMKLWDGAQLHAEYAGFKVGDASTNYRMTYQEMIMDRSSVRFDGLRHSKGSQFSTIDRDNDGYGGSCSNAFGRGGWWFKNCHRFNPNGIYGGGSTWPDMVLYTGSVLLPLREVRLMLQV